MNEHSEKLTFEAIMKENLRREKRITISEEISCDFGRILELSSQGIFIASCVNGIAENDPIKLTITTSSGSVIKIQARIRRITQGGFGAKIDKSATDIADLDQFHLLVKKYRRI